MELHHKLKDVDYRPKYITLGEFNETGHDYTIITKIKSKSWEYEREWRLILARKTFDDPYKHIERFPPEILTGLIIGWHMSDKHRKDIKGIIENYNLNIKLYEATRSYDEFKMEINEIPTP